MAQITFPTGVTVKSLDLAVVWPGRISHRVPQTDAEVIIDRGRPHWAGTVVVNEVETGAVANAVEAWANQMAQHENFTELPLGSRASEFTATTVASVASNTVTLTAVPAGLSANDFIRSGNRLYQVTSLVAATKQVTLHPEGVVAAGDAFSEARTVRVRFASSAHRAPRAGGFAGPWSVSVREAV